MEKETDLRRGRHVVFNLHIHLVFVAKYRRKVFTKEILDVEIPSVVYSILGEY